MLRDWLPLRPRLAIAFLIYWFGSLLVAAQINGSTERITDPIAAAVVATACAVASVLFLGPLMSRPMHNAILRSDTQPSRTGFLFVGLLSLAFTVGLFYVATQV